MLDNSFIPFTLLTHNTIDNNINNTLKDFKDINFNFIRPDADHWEKAFRRDRLSKNIATIFKNRIKNESIFYIDFANKINANNDIRHLYICFKENLWNYFKSDVKNICYPSTIDLFDNQGLIKYFNLHKQLIFHYSSKFSNNIFYRVIRREKYIITNKKELYVVYDNKPQLKLKYSIDDIKSLIKSIILIDSNMNIKNVSSHFI